MAALGAEGSPNSFTLNFPKVEPANANDKKLDTEPVHYHVRSWFLDSNVQKLVRHGCSHGTTDESSSPTVLKRRGGVKNSFVGACVLAFDSHLPLTLRPQFFWLAIVQAVALHVQGNAEELRDQFVGHEGKKELKLDVTEEAVKGFTQEDWEGVVRGFEGMLRDHTKEGVVESLGCSDFSDSTIAENVSSLMTCMDVLKSYFDYKMCTRCGFPSITLEGTVEDWKLLKKKAVEVIKSSTLSKFSKKWLPPLKDTLNKLIKAREGEVDVDFWESFVKVDGTKGSGAKTWVNGWINVFFPLKPGGSLSPFCEKYEKGAVKKASDVGKGKRPKQKGLETSDFPNGLSSAPVTLDGHLLDFQAGFVGIEQNSETGGIKPTVGWMVASGACPRSGKFGNPDKKQANEISTNVGAAIPLLDFVHFPRK